MTDRNNVLIALSPYFFPLYAVVGVLAFLITGLFVDLTRLIPLPWGGGVRPLYRIVLPHRPNMGIPSAPSLSG